jgi:hypothetical protein
MSYSNRIWLYGPVGLLLLVAVLYSVYWRVGADMLSARLDRANGGEIVPGIVFAFAEKSVGGYPFRFDTVLSGVTFAHQGPEGETAWRSEKLAIHALSYGQALYVLEAAGLQSFALPGGAGEGPRVTYLTPGIARASAILRQGHLARFDLDLWQAEGKDATPGADMTRTFSAGRAQLHLLNDPDGTVEVAARIDDAHIGDGFKPALGSALALAELRGKLVQGTTLDPLKAGAESVPDAAEQWRQAGGTLSVEKLDLDWRHRARRAAQA